jgi:ferritin-like metal-binding protein YciE
MADEKTLDDLFHDTLRDIYYAEKQLVKALPRMAKAAQDPMLAEGFESHLAETEGHVERLERIFEIIGVPARAKTCEAILGILEEGKSVMEDYKGTISLDAGLIAAGQAAEHYEIARYGTLKTWASQLGLSEAAKLLDQTLNEEKAADRKLTDLAVSQDNAKAA